MKFRRKYKSKYKLSCVVIFLCITIFTSLTSCEFLTITFARTIKFGNREIVIPSEEELNRDVSVIPDKYNTGVKKGTVFSKITVPVGELQNVNGVNILNREMPAKNGVKSYEYQISGNRNTNMADEVIIENFDFSDRKFTFLNTDKFETKKMIIFRNCKFKNLANAGDNNPLYLIFENCTFLGNVSEVNIYLSHCYIGGFFSDATNPLKYFIVQDSYICDLVNSTLTSGELHIDGTQSFGRKDIQGGPVMFNNVRFEIPSIHYEGSRAGVNACVMFQLEYGSIHNVYYMNLICNGGGKWYPLYLKKNSKFPSTNINLVNVKVSNNFGTIFYPTDYHTEANVKNVEHLSNLYVSSVWKDANGVHIICTNDTSIDKTLTVKTDKGDYTFAIPHCPSNWALGGEIDKKVNPDEALVDSKGKSYKEYRFSDMPFDIDCRIPVNVSSVTCFDGDTQIRKVRF